MAGFPWEGNIGEGDIKENEGWRLVFPATLKNKEGREGRRLIMGVDVVRNLLLGTLGQGCCEIPMKILSKPLSI